tara:strand:- start:1713 stop:2177 length:465 start_codon:yes stop_codon:yes gene_type:complete
MNKRRMKRFGAISLVIAGCSIATGLIIYALGQNVNLFYMPTDIVHGIDGKKPEIGQRLRVGGMVVEGSLKRDPKNLYIEFDLHDNNEIITINYEGILPDLFKEGQGVVAQGTLIDKEVIRATEVLAKHDENYIPPELAEGLKQNHSGKGLTYGE